MITGKNIESYIERDGIYVTQTVGISMLPFIRQGHSTVLIVPKQGRLKKYDVALFHRRTGEYVLHRVVKVRKDDYVFCGDNQKAWEYGITDDLIVGVMKELYNDGVLVDTKTEEYNKKVKKIVRKSRISSYIIRVKRALGKIGFLKRIVHYFKGKK